MKIFKKEQAKVNFERSTLTAHVDCVLIKDTIPSEFLKRELTERLRYRTPRAVILSTEVDTHFYLRKEYNDITISPAERYVNNKGDVMFWFDTDTRKTVSQDRFEYELDLLLKGGTIHGRQ